MRRTPGRDGSLPAMDPQPLSARASSTLLWYRVYCALMALMYLACIAGGIAMLGLEPDELDMSATEARVMGIGLAAISLVLTAVYVLALVLPRKPWVWIYGLVMICIGLTSICCMPMTIPLLIFWVKEDMLIAFGRKTTPDAARGPADPPWN